MISSASLEVNSGIADDVLQHLMSIPNAMVKIVQERAQEFLGSSEFYELHKF